MKDVVMVVVDLYVVDILLKDIMFDVDGRV